MYWTSSVVSSFQQKEENNNNNKREYELDDGNTNTDAHTDDLFSAIDFSSIN